MTFTECHYNGTLLEWCIMLEFILDLFILFIQNTKGIVFINIYIFGLFLYLCKWVKNGFYQ